MTMDEKVSPPPPEQVNNHLSFTAKDLKALLDGIDRLSKVCGIIGAPMPFICALIIVYEIIMRSVFDSPTPWVAETTAMLCASCYFLGGAWNVKTDSHIRVDIIYSKFPPRVRAGMDCLNFCFMALYIGVMLKVIWPYMMQSIQLNESSYTFWNPIVWPLKIVLFSGFALVLLQGTANFCRNLYFMLMGREL